MRSLFLAAFLTACSTPAYDACDIADDCAFPEDAVAACVEKSDALKFCAVTCDADVACDVVDDAFDWVCAPFESSPESYCFPACADEGPECPPGYGCRSTGGGADNEKICFPS